LKYKQASTKVFKLTASPEFDLEIFRISTKGSKYTKYFKNDSNVSKGPQHPLKWAQAIKHLRTFRNQRTKMLQNAIKTSFLANRQNSNNLAAFWPKLYEMKRDAN